LILIYSFVNIDQNKMGFVYRQYLYYHLI